MPQVITNKAHQLNRLHETLPVLGGTLADYRVEGGGYDPMTGQGRPDFLRITTELPGVTEALLNAVLTGHNSLPVSSDKSVLAADGNDTATIICNAPALANDISVDYGVWLNGSVYSAVATAPVVSGTVTLTLTTEEAGEYLIEMRRRGVGNYQSGYITLQAQEVAG